MGIEYFCCYHSYLEVMEQLNDAEKGRLFTACLQYSKTGEVPQLSGNERFVFPTFKAQIDRDNAKYQEKCRKQSENIKKRWNTSEYQSIPTDTTVYHRIPPYTNDTKTKEKEKEKEKTKTKENTPPVPPSRGEPGKQEDGLACLREPLRGKLQVWLDYKRERRESYKPTGLSALVSKVSASAEKYGNQAVMDLIDQAMSCGYKGIPFDRLAQKNPGMIQQPEKREPGEFERRAIQRMMEWGEQHAE